MLKNYQKCYSTTSQNFVVTLSLFYKLESIPFFNFVTLDFSFSIRSRKIEKKWDGNLIFHRSWKKNHTKKNQAVYIENSRHFLVKRVYYFFVQKQKKNEQSFLKNCRLCSSLSVPVYYIVLIPSHIPPCPPLKNLAKNDTKWCCYF